jgi:hypothetical protein
MFINIFFLFFNYQNYNVIIKNILIKFNQIYLIIHLNYIQIYKYYFNPLIYNYNDI